MGALTGRAEAAAGLSSAGVSSAGLSSAGLSSGSDQGVTGSRHVAVVDGWLHVHGWRTRAPEVVRYFEERLGGQDAGDLAEVLETALKVGVLSLASVGVSVNVDYVQKEFERLAGRVEQTLQARMREMETAFTQTFADDDGRLAQALRQYLGEGGQLAELFDPNRRDSAVSRMRDLLREHLDGEGSTLHRLLDLSNAGSPLSGWKGEIDGHFDRLRRLIEDYRREVAESAAAQVAAHTARAEEREKGTQKGRDFEQRVYAELNRVAAVFGDCAEPTGDATGVGGGKVGDVTVTLNARDTRGAMVRLVFEAKDKQMGLTPILRELDAAKQNRGAVAAVAVFSREEWMPAGAAPFREQGSGRYLCLQDKDSDEPLCLQLAYRVARFWALQEIAGEQAEVDTRGIRDDLETARHQLHNVSTVKARLTRLRNSVDDAATEIEQQLENLRAGLVQSLDRIDGRIRPAEG